MAVVAVLGLLAIPKLRSGNDASGGAPASGGGAPPPLQVQAHVVTAERLSDKILTTGTILADEEVELRAEIAGRVERILFDEGRPVRAGATLVKINDDDLQARLQQAQYRLELASDRAERQQALLSKGGISQEEYEATQNEVNVLEAEAELIQVQIDKTEIRAPFSGVVGLRAVSQGSYLSPNTPVATLQALNPVKVEFSIPEKYAGRVAVGDEIVFTVEGRDDTFRGTIYAFEPKIDETTRTLRVRARSPNDGGRLVPGAFASIELIFDTIDDALTVPPMAVIPELGGKKVFVARGGTAEPRQVETGIRLSDRVQITDGLAPSDTVIVTGIQSLRPGLPVRVTGLQGSGGGDTS